MEVVTVSRILRCGTNYLVQIKGEDNLSGLYENVIYDFSNARKVNVVAMTEKDVSRTRGRITKAVVRKVVNMWEYSCAYCFVDLHDEDYHIDHIIPVSFGGGSNISNLALACVPCNSKKADKLFPNMTAIRDFIANGSSNCGLVAF